MTWRECTSKDNGLEATACLYTMKTRLDTGQVPLCNQLLRTNLGKPVIKYTFKTVRLYHFGGLKCVVWQAKVCSWPVSCFRPSMCALWVLADTSQWMSLKIFSIWRISWLMLSTLSSSVIHCFWLSRVCVWVFICHMTWPLFVLLLVVMRVLDVGVFRAVEFDKLLKHLAWEFGFVTSVFCLFLGRFSDGMWKTGE